MFTFLKAQASSLISTAVDFLVTFALSEIFGLYYLVANVIGITCGGITNFLLGRYVVFSSKEKKVETQAFRYVLVWLGNFALNIGGVYLFTEGFHIDDKIAKVIVSMIVGFSYNYVLQKFFVFKK